MTDLSPAAQAVLNSYMEEDRAGRLAAAAALVGRLAGRLAVALEAVADQVVPANGSRSPAEDPDILTL